LVNRFTERYRTEGRRNVRSREVWILKVEISVLKKKRECESEEGEGDTRERVIDRRVSARLVSYKTCRVLVSSAPYSTPWCAHVHVYTEGAKEHGVLQ
jgi:hypothetical protein